LYVCFSVEAADGGYAASVLPGRIARLLVLQFEKRSRDKDHLVSGSIAIEKLVQ
jgi:hypothetical protein